MIRTLPELIIVFKLRRKRWEGHVTLMGEKIKLIQVLVGKACRKKTNLEA